MTAVSLWTMFVAWIVIGVVVFLAAPHLPRWIGFAFSLGFSIYMVVEILRDGPEASEVALLLFFGTFSMLGWWRDRRGTRGGSPPGT